MPVKLLRQQNGLSLVEILIAVGLFSVVAAASSSFLLSSVRMKVDLQEKQGFIELANRIASASRSEKLCSEYELSFPAGTSLNISQAGSNAGQLVNLKVDNQTIDGSSDQAPYGLIDSELRISNLKPLGANNAAGQPMYQGILRFRAQKANSELGGKEIRNRMIGSAIVAVGGGQITSCHGDVQVVGTGCLVDPATGVCVGGNLPTQTCPAGSVVSGYLNGNVQCKPLDATCAADQAVTAIVNGVPLCTTIVKAPASAGPVTPVVSTGIELENRNFATDLACEGVGPCYDYYNPPAIQARLGMPECTIPVLNQKCFYRTHSIAVVEYVGAMTEMITIKIGAPKW